MSSISQPRQIFLAALTVVTVAGACYPFAEQVGYRSVALLLLLTVSVLAMRQGLAAVLTAAVLSALLWDYFFVPPQFTFHIHSTEDVLFMTMYLIVAALNGVINHRLRQIETLNREKADRENALKLYGTLFSSLSHDLRTPIATVLGAADTLRESSAQLADSQRFELLDEISSAAVRLSDQVETLLNTSRIEAGMVSPKKEWTDVADLLFGLVKKNPPTDGRTVEVAVPEGLPLVRLDFGLTEQALQNLLANALHHTPPGSRVKLAARVEGGRRGHFERDEAEAYDSLRPVKDRDEDSLVLEVSDNGAGFPEQEIRQVFEKFHRPSGTKADGTGLGLFVARGFTEAQGGEISLRNLPGGGACFTLEFPTEIFAQNVHHD